MFFKSPGRDGKPQPLNRHDSYSVPLKDSARYSGSMPALRRKQNYRNIILAADTQHETVGVYLRSGLTRDVIWKGFVDVRHARGTPVKLHIHSYQVVDYGPWILLKENECIQGCVVVGEGVYGALIDGVPRVINTIA